MVCREGDDSEHLYIIRKGEFEVSKVIGNKIKLVESKKSKVQIKPASIRNHALV